MNTQDKVEVFLKRLRIFFETCKSAGIFIMVFELFKNQITDRAQGFFSDDSEFVYNQNHRIKKMVHTKYDPQYAQYFTGKVKDIFLNCENFLIDCQILDETDRITIENCVNFRNYIAHELHAISMEKIFEVPEEKMLDFYDELVKKMRDVRDLSDKVFRGCLIQFEDCSDKIAFSEDTRCPLTDLITLALSYVSGINFAQPFKHPQTSD